MAAKSHFIDGRWIDGAGAPFASHDPATGNVVWEGRSAQSQEIDQAVTAARKAIAPWANVPLKQRIYVLERFAEQLKEHRPELAEAISQEVGKPRWEAISEVDSMIGKI